MSFTKKSISLSVVIFSLNTIASSNICYQLNEHPSWYWAALDTQHKWGIPVSVQMAIVREESGFRSHAQTPSTKLFGFTLWHQSTAEGFPQALDGTWHRYVILNHKISANRADFTDASDFMGWYLHDIHVRAHVANNDAYRLYLAYHEGLGGFRAHSYLHQPWLMAIAHNVSTHAYFYHQQITHCDLPTHRWY